MGSGSSFRSSSRCLGFEEAMPPPALLLLQKGELSALLSAKAFVSSVLSVCEITPLF